VQSLIEFVQEPTLATAAPAKNKKTDVAEYPEEFSHVGLLFNEPLGTAELLLS
jgi:hypothetical protein